MIVSTQSTKMNTHVRFSCANGNALIGAPEIVCLPSGNWSSPFPICESKLETMKTLAFRMKLAKAIRFYFSFFCFTITANTFALTLYASCSIYTKGVNVTYSSHLFEIVFFNLLNNDASFLAV